MAQITITGKREKFYFCFNFLKTIYLFHLEKNNSVHFDNYAFLICRMTPATFVLQKRCVNNSISFQFLQSKCMKVNINFF